MTTKRKHFRGFGAVLREPGKEPRVIAHVESEPPTEAEQQAHLARLSGAIVVADPDGGEQLSPEQIDRILDESDPADLADDDHATGDAGANGEYPLLAPSSSLDLGSCDWPGA